MDLLNILQELGHNYIDISDDGKIQYVSENQENMLLAHGIGNCEKISEFISEDISSLDYYKRHTVTMFSRTDSFKQDILMSPLADEKSGRRVVFIRQNNNDEVPLDPVTMRKFLSIGVFAGGIVHDYNNALTVVLGNISLAKLESENNPDLLESLSDIEEAAVNIKDLTERLSTYSKGLKPEKEITKIDEFVEKFIKIKLQDNLFSYSFKSENDDLLVEMDKLQIELAINEIVQNSIESIPRENGRIDVIIKRESVGEEKYFKEISLNTGNYATIEIVDNGSGVDVASTSEIFEPFFTTKENRAGVGLALVYAVIKRHKGFMEIGSPGESGFSIKIYLPLA